MNRPDNNEQILGMLSAYLDGELTQADDQRVRLYVEQNEEARRALDEMRQLQQVTSGMRFASPPEEIMDALEHRVTVRAPRGLGWLLVLAGLVSWLLYAAVVALRNLRWPTLPELLSGAIVAGFILLFLSVLRQRWLERPHDRYRKVRK